MRTPTAVGSERVATRCGLGVGHSNLTTPIIGEALVLFVGVCVISLKPLAAFRSFVFSLALVVVGTVSSRREQPVAVLSSLVLRDANTDSGQERVRGYSMRSGASDVEMGSVRCRPQLQGAYIPEESVVSDASYLQSASISVVSHQVLFTG